MKRVFDYLERILSFLVIILGAALVLDVILQILGRYVLTRPVSWTEELSRYLLAGIVAFATPVVARKDQYIRVDMLLNKLPKKVRGCCVCALDILVAVFLLIVAYHAVSLVQVGALQKSPVLRIPMSYLYTSVLIGPALTGIFFLEKAVNEIKAIKREDD